jgi:hypothetical protein
MISVWNAGKNQARLSTLAYPAKHPPQSGEVIYWGACFCHPATFNSGLQFGRNSFLNERTGNVVENKGPLWKTREQSGNVHENTGS